MTTHARAAARQADILNATKDGRDHLAACRSAVTHPAARQYTDAIAQPYGGWTDGQLAAYGQVDQLIAEGTVDKVVIPVGARPGRDRDRDGNQRKLAAGLPPVFTAEVYPGTSHDGDALLSWPASMTMPWTNDDGDNSHGQLTDWRTSAPLEIGHTDASRTFLHLLDSGIVARWPYHSEDVWVFFIPTLDGYQQWRQSLTSAVAA